MTEDLGDKLILIFSFTMGTLILGIGSGAVLGGVVFNAFFRIDSAINEVVAGILTGGIIGALVGFLNGLVLGIVTAYFYHPLRQRGNYHSRMILLALVFTAGGILILMSIASSQGDDRSIVQLGMSGALMGIPSAIFSAFIVAGWYMRTQPRIE